MCWAIRSWNKKERNLGINNWSFAHFLWGLLHDLCLLLCNNMSSLLSFNFVIFIYLWSRSWHIKLLPLFSHELHNLLYIFYSSIVACGFDYMWHNPTFFNYLGRTIFFAKISYSIISICLIFNRSISNCFFGLWLFQNIDTITKMKWTMTKKMLKAIKRF